MTSFPDAQHHADWVLGWLRSGVGPPASELQDRLGPEMLAAQDASAWHRALGGMAGALGDADVVTIEVIHPYLIRQILRTQAGPLVRMAVRASENGALSSLSFGPPFRAMTWTDHYLPTGDGDLRVRDYGGEGSPVVLLHCGMADVSHWDRAVRQLPGRRLAIDLRGHGHWPAAVGFGPSAVAGDLRALVEHFELGAPALVGHSLGGWTALACASLGVPIDRLVTFDGPNEVGPPRGVTIPADTPDGQAVFNCVEPLGARDQFESVTVPWLAVMCRIDDDKVAGREEVAVLVASRPRRELLWLETDHQSVVTNHAALETTAKFLV
jgi:hypothetical protein